MPSAECLRVRLYLPSIQVMTAARARAPGAADRQQHPVVTGDLSEGSAGVLNAAVGVEDHALHGVTAVHDANPDQGPASGRAR